MQSWSTFYAVSGGAAATLLGLLFVAVSMNGAVVLGDAQGGSEQLAEQAFRNYLTVLLISLLALFPQMKTSEFAASTLGLTVISGGWALLRLFSVLSRPLEREAKVYSFRRHLLSFAGFAILIASAVDILMTRADHRSWFAAAVMILVASATTVSWELLGRIAKAKP